MPALPEADRELGRLARLFPRRRLLRGRAATPAAYASEAPRHDVIHFASHALSDPRAPGLSGVLLAPERVESVYWRFPWLNAGMGFALFVLAASRWFG